MVGRRKSLAIAATSAFLIALTVLLTWYYSYDHLPKISIDGTNLILSTEYLPEIQKRAKVIESIDGVDLKDTNEESSNAILKTNGELFDFDMQILSVKNIGNAETIHEIDENNQRIAKQYLININGERVKRLELIDYTKNENRVIELNPEREYDFTLTNKYLVYIEKPQMFLSIKHFSKKTPADLMLENQIEKWHNFYYYNPSTETTFVISKDKYSYLSYKIIENTVYWYAHREGSIYSWDTKLYDFRKTDLSTRKTEEWKLPEDVKIFLLKTGKIEFDGKYIIYEGFNKDKGCFGLGLYVYDTINNKTIVLTNRYLYDYGGNNFTGQISRSYRFVSDERNNKTYVFWNQLIEKGSRSFLDVAYTEISDSDDAQIKHVFDPHALDRDYTLESVSGNRIAIRSFYYQLPSVAINPQMELWLVDVSNLRPELITRRDGLVITSCMLNKKYLTWSEDDLYFTIDTPSYPDSASQKRQFDLSWERRDKKYRKVLFLEIGLD